jgi:HD-like signal output (HDOD) protein
MIDSFGSTITASVLPTQVGRFQIVRRLGQGAQSLVYLAFDPQLHREVAVKVFKGDAAKADVLLNEARSVSRLSHPSIIPVFEAAHDAQDGTAYLVFEYVAGPTLAEVLRQQGALEPLLAVKMLLPALDAVAYAHANGVIHRDLKPSNILMDRRGMAKVMDFGIAVRQVKVGEVGEIADTPQDDENLTELVGTPAYMAPEYVQHHRVSAQMDIFSAGLILYEMLTGRRAAPGESGIQAIHFLINHEVVLPDVLAHPVDDRLRAALSRALARDPALRFVRMADFVQALRAWAEPQPELLEPADNSGNVAGGRLGAVVNATAQAVALEGLLRRMRLKSEMPALPESLTQITRMAASDDQNLGVITAAILQDAAVTHKLLRVVNSAMYRGFGGGAISTVSRAVQLLGYAAVRTAASALPLLDLTKNQVQSARVLDEMVLAHFCGVLARELSGLRDKDAEESFVCGSVNRLGNVLVACYFPEEAGEIERQCHSGKTTRDRAVRQVLGLGYEALGMGVAKHWGLPDDVVRSMRAPSDAPLPGEVLPEGEVHALAPPTTKAQSLRLISACAAALTSAWLLDSVDRRNVAAGVISQRYAKALGITSKDLKAAIEVAESALKRQFNALRQDIGHSAVAMRLKLVAIRPTTAAAVATQATVVAPVYRAPVPPANPRGTEALAKAIQVLAGRLLEPYKLNEVVLIALEAIRVAGAFRQVIFCLRDGKTPTMVGRIAVGASATGDVDAGRLRLPIDNASDVLAAACHHAEDLWMPDIAHPEPHQAVSSQFRQSSAAGAVLLLPLSLKGQPLGLIYADRAVNAVGPALDESEMALLATLRNQVALAFRQRTF